MTHRGPFQPRPFCDSVRRWQFSCTVSSSKCFPVKTLGAAGPASRAWLAGESTHRAERRAAETRRLSRDPHEVTVGCCVFGSDTKLFCLGAVAGARWSPEREGQCC